MFKKYFCVVFFILLLRYSAIASDTLVINSSGNNYIFGNYIQMVCDKEEKLTFSSIQKKQNWEELSEVTRLNLKETNTVYWFRFSIKNNDKLGQYWAIEFPDGHNSFLQFHEISSNGKKTIHPPIGIDFPISSRAIDHKNFIYELRIPEGETHTYYVKVKSSYLSSFWASVRTTSFLISYIAKEYYFIGVFYGILFIMAIYNFFIFLFTREKVYLLYVLYVVSCGFYTLSEDLIGFHLFWPETTFFNHFQFENAPSILIATFTFYSIEFLDLKSNSKKFVYFLYALIVLNLLTSIALAQIIPAQFKALLFITPFAVIYYQAIRLFYKRKFKPARFFILGYSIILFGFLVYVLRTYGIYPSTLYTIYIFNFGFVLEVTIFSYALGDKIKIIKEQKELNHLKIIEVLEEKEILKDKINKELEQKVFERTSELQNTSHELKNANEKLKNLSEELNKINSQLDIDNWNLKKQVKSETRSRILVENVSYTDFLTLFPDETSCFKYLEKLKWENGFSCKKCSNLNYSNGEKEFSRKCTKCKYTESVTSGTLFHALKFSITKAFYITYDSFKENSIYTVEELSETIELRKATAWTFRKKVQDQKLAKLKLKKPIESWEDIIVD